jgi:hypothetical protein
MTVLADWVHAAFEAARRHDQDATLGAIDAITTYGRDAMLRACTDWIDRTHLVMELCSRKPLAEGKIHIRVLTDHGDVGADVIKPHGGSRWACRMFLARVTEDAAMWHRLTAHLPDDRLRDYTFALVNAMAITALHYVDNVRPDADADHDEPCCIYHQIVKLMDPMRCADLNAVAHLN